MVAVSVTEPPRVNEERLACVVMSGVTGVTCGVGFGCQLVPVVPVEPHDVTVNLVATPQGLVGPASGP